MGYPIKNNNKDIFRAVFRGNNLIRKGFKGDYNGFLSKRKEWGRRDSKDVYGNKQGGYSSSRQKLHKTIVRKTVNVKGTLDRRDPDVYFLGGMTASGKTTALRKFVKEPVVVADADKVKVSLARVNPSPFKNYPLANASFLHRESSDVNKQVIERARAEKRDILIDTTSRNPQKTAENVAAFKKAGYDVHFLGTQKQTPEAVRNTASRFLSTGRFVPLGFVAATGNQINATVWSGAHKKGLFDDARVVDTSDGKGNVVYQRGDINKNYRNPS